MDVHGRIRGLSFWKLSKYYSIVNKGLGHEKERLKMYKEQFEICKDCVPRPSNFELDEYSATKHVTENP